MTPTVTLPAAPTPPASADCRTLADLVRRLGGVPLERIRCHPAPGTATEADLLHGPDGDKLLCELVDGVLVEKPMGSFESRLAAVLIYFIEQFLDRHDLGIVLGADGMLRLIPGLVRIPDVSFLSWERFPEREQPVQSIWGVVPDLAVEVLSENNTAAEMERKLDEYFAAGVRLVWYVDPEPRTVRVYSSPTECRLLTEVDTLEGGEVLPDFRLSVGDWFERAWRRRS